VLTGEGQTVSGRAWKLYAVVAVAITAGFVAVPTTVGWHEVAARVAIGYFAAITIVVRTRRNSWSDWLPWWCFALGISANASGIAVGYYIRNVLQIAPYPSVADLCDLLLYVAVATGLVLIIRRRSMETDWAALVDTTTITTGLGLLAWVFVIQPAALNQALPLLGRITEVAYPVGDIMLLAMTVRLLRGGGDRNSSFWWLTAALGSFMVGDTTWVVLGSLNVDPVGVGARLVHAVYLCGFLLFGLAAVHPSARDVSAPAPPEAPRLSAPMLAMLTVTSMIAPAILAQQVWRGEVTDGAAIVVGSAALFLLVVTRMAQLLRQVEHQATRVRDLARQDELTGLPNRRAWNDELPRVLERARRDRTPVCVAILDLDHFKLFNDTYGHPAGDRLLKAAAAAWHGELRAVDTLARYGGEEFVVLLPNVNTTRAIVVLDRAKQATPLGQTFSAGVAVWDGTETSDQLLSRADEALYAAKADGRNQITAAAPRVPEQPVARITRREARLARAAREHSDR
jgi:diguanylate cyclase (GGDEF)-like protein